METMICSICGYIQADSEHVCRRCGQDTSVRKATSLARMESKRLLTDAEVVGAGGTFPREVQSAVTVPAWRAELSARVRQVKARRLMESELEAARRDQRGEPGRRRDGQADGQAEPAASDKPISDKPMMSALEAEIAAQPRPPEADREEAAAPPLDDLDLVENPLVRGALRRVRRAAESPRAPMTFPPRRANAAPPEVLTLDATAMAAAPATPLVDISEIASELDAALGDFDLLLDQPAPTATASAPAVAKEATAPQSMSAQSPARLTRRVRPLARERVLAGVVDTAVVALSCIPLLCVIVMTGVTLAHPGVAAIVVCAAALIAGMYLFGTVTVAGQTFGMMYMGLRVTSIYEDHELNALQALLRAIGCGLSLLPLGAGFLWVLIDRDQRGWHEYLSATQLVREWRVEALSDREMAGA
ncbi:MAG: hypothetical protein CFK52_03745 [Chloracidobacterium sp. CP2_5A]|nr:MAG: hypothetical protein CFK52_03745 [Chloracidobacterium sp. CP2_5A]